MHHLPAWRDPHLLEGGDSDGGQDHDDNKFGIYMSVTTIAPIGKLIVDEMAGERRGVDLCQSEGNT